MLKLPFIEKTYVGLELTSEHLFWVEINKLGNRIEVLSYGELSLGETIESTINELETHLVSDAYLLGVADKRLLANHSLIDAPIFEDEDEYEGWRESQTKEIELNDNQIVLISHLSSLNEDEKRLHIQQNYQKVIEEITTNFESAGYPLSYVTNGFVDIGYSQILNPAFVESYTGVITENNDGFQLLLFNQGRIEQVYELGQSQDPTSILAAADSILTSEEHTFELATNSILCFHCFEGDINLNTSRVFTLMFPYFKKGKENLDIKLSTAAATALKMCYPELDQLHLLTESDQLKAQFHYDKTELLRTAILLFAPIIVFLLTAFAVEKWNEPALNEYSQVSGLLGEKIDKVAAERKSVLELKNEFDQLKNEYASAFYTAPVYELIATSIPEAVWLEEISIIEAENKLFTELTGKAEKSEWISTFIQNIQQSGDNIEVQLLQSDKSVNDQTGQELIAFSLRIESMK